MKKKLVLDIHNTTTKIGGNLIFLRKKITEYTRFVFKSFHWIYLIKDLHWFSNLKNTRENKIEIFAPKKKHSNSTILFLKPFLLRRSVGIKQKHTYVI